MKGRDMRIITIKIARLIAALFIIGGFSSTVPIAAAAPKEQTEITESVPPTAPVHEAPVKVVGDIPSQRITMGHAHTCVIDAHNDVWCWGSNGFGGLGRGYASDEVFPQKQAIQSLKATSIFAKSNGKTCATDTGGSVICWGIQGTDKYAAGATDKINAPVQKHPGLPEDKKFKRAVGGCFIDSDDMLWCENKQGIGQRMGDIKVQSGGGSSSEGCAVSLDHSLYCWEEKSTSRIPLEEPSKTPKKIEGMTAALISSGTSDNMCVVETDGTPHCWGRDMFNELGHDAKTRNKIDLSKLKVTSISSGFHNTCVVDNRQVPWCWGGTFGGIVDENRPLRGLGVPANYKNLEVFDAVAVATQDYRTCFVDTQGAFWCWGRNKDGTLGNGTTTDSPVPVKVEGLTVALTP